MFRGVMFALVFLAAVGCLLAVIMGLMPHQPAPVVYSLKQIKTVMPERILVEPSAQIKALKHGGQVPPVPSVVKEEDILALGKVTELSEGITDIYQVLICTDGDGKPELAILLIQSDMAGYAILVGAIDISEDHEGES